MEQEKYKMVTVYQYLNALDKKVTFIDKDEIEIKKAIRKYLSNIRRADRNAVKLDKLLT